MRPLKLRVLEKQWKNDIKILVQKFSEMQFQPIWSASLSKFSRGACPQTPLAGQEFCPAARGVAKFLYLTWNLLIFWAGSAPGSPDHAMLLTVARRHSVLTKAINNQKIASVMLEIGLTYSVWVILKSYKQWGHTMCPPWFSFICDSITINLGMAIFFDKTSSK